MLNLVRSCALAVLCLSILVGVAGCGGGNTPLAAPTGLTATGGSNRVDLAWEAPAIRASLAGYNVYRSATAGTGYTKLNATLLPTSPTTYADTTAVSGTPYYYVVRAVGSDALETADSAEATATPSGRANHVWSPDGARLVFVSNRDGDNEIYTMGVDGTGLQRLTDNTIDDSYPCWSPDGTRVVFVTVIGGVGARLFTVNADGSGLAQLSDEPADQPEWSPDGTKIAYVSGSAIWVANADGSTPTNLTSGSSGSAPSWSPDGARIVFTSPRAGTIQVFVMNSDGSGVEQLTTTVNAPTTPSWTPDGRHIQFVSTEGTHQMSPDGSGQTTVSTSALYDWRLSPDRTKGAFVRWVPGVPADTDTDVFACDPDGTGETNVTNTPGLDWLH